MTYLMELACCPLRRLLRPQAAMSTLDSIQSFPYPLPQG